MENPYSFLALSIIIFRDIQYENLKLVSQQYRAWSDCKDVQAGLALYWWQRLITFGVGRIRVKNWLDYMYNILVLWYSIINEILRWPNIAFHNITLTFILLLMIVKPLQTTWNQTRRLVRFQVVCHPANMSSKFSVNC